MRKLPVPDPSVNHADKLFGFPTYRLQLVREAPGTGAPPEALQGPEDVARSLRPLLDGLDREHFVVLALDTRNRAIGGHVVAVGTLSCCVVHPREVYKFAVLANACSVILAHNHPSGDATPSQDDLELTRRLAKAGELMGIQVLDHVIFGDGSAVSLKERGLL